MAIEQEALELGKLKTLYIIKLREVNPSPLMDAGIVVKMQIFILSLILVVQLTCKEKITIDLIIQNQVMKQTHVPRHRRVKGLI